MIDSHVLLHADRAAYGSEVIRGVSDDLSVGYQRLYSSACSTSGRSLLLGLFA